jgi:hypothetical protein
LTSDSPILADDFRDLLVAFVDEEVEFIAWLEKHPPESL